MGSKAKAKFDEDYLFVRHELVAGNRVMTRQAVLDWMKERVVSLEAEMLKEAQDNIKTFGLHADREVEAYRFHMRQVGYSGEESGDD